ncbi:BCCT family transporter [soil metagenome]
MNNPRSYHGLPLYTFIIVSLCLGLFCIFAPNLLLYACKTGYLWLFAALILAFSSLGKLRVGQSEVVLNTPHPLPEVALIRSSTTFSWCRVVFAPHAWLFKFFGIQIAVGVVFWGLAHTLLQGFPIPTDRGGVSLIAASQQAIYDLSIGWGLHPWPLTLLTAIVLAYFSDKQGGQQVSYYATLLPLLKRRTTATYAIGSNIALRQSLFMLCATTLILVLQLLGWFSYFFGSHFNVYAMTPIALIAFTAVIVSISVQQWQNLTLYTWEHYWSLSRQMLLQTLFTGGLILVIYTAASMGANFFPATVFKPIEIWLPLPQWQPSWRIFYWCWWLAATVLLSLWISQIIKGQRIRSIIYWGLLLPSMWALIAIITTYPTLIPLLTQPITTLWQKLFTSPLLSISAIIILIVYFFRSKDFDKLIMTSLTWKTTLPPTQQISLLMARNVLQLVALIIVLYLLSGLSFLHILCFVMIAPWLLFLVTISLSALRNVYEKTPPT